MFLVHGRSNAADSEKDVLEVPDNDDNPEPRLTEANESVGGLASLSDGIALVCRFRNL